MTTETGGISTSTQVLMVYAKKGTSYMAWGKIPFHFGELDRFKYCEMQRNLVTGNVTIDFDAMKEGDLKWLESRKELRQKERTEIKSALGSEVVCNKEKFLVLELKPEGRMLCANMERDDDLTILVSTSKKSDAQPAS